MYEKMKTSLTPSITDLILYTACLLALYATQGYSHNFFRMSNAKFLTVAYDFSLINISNSFFNQTDHSCLEVFLLYHRFPFRKMKIKKKRTPIRLSHRKPVSPPNISIFLFMKVRTRETRHL